MMTWDFGSFMVSDQKVVNTILKLLESHQVWLHVQNNLISEKRKSYFGNNLITAFKCPYNPQSYKSIQFLLISECGY